MRCITLKFNFESENGFQKESMQLTWRKCLRRPGNWDDDFKTPSPWSSFERLRWIGGLSRAREGRVPANAPVDSNNCCVMSPYNWWIIAWVGKVQWPQTPKRSKIIFSTQKQLSKELKDELQKKADASKFGSLFSNITPVVDGDCSWPKVVSWKVNCLWINPDFLIPQGISN